MSRAADHVIRRAFLEQRDLSHDEVARVARLKRWPEREVRRLFNREPRRPL